MTIAVNGAAPTNPVATLLADKGIRKVGIIDDAYDPLEEIQLRESEVDDLWKYLEFDDKALDELKTLGFTVAARDDITVAMLVAFERRADDFPNVAGIWTKSLLGQRVQERLSQVRKVAELLTMSLGLEVTELGRNASSATLHDAQLIFLDWYLGDDDHEPAVSVAVEKAKAIYHTWPEGQPKPLIVLMSSREEVVKAAEEFRRSSRLLAGMFHAVPKKLLTDPFTLHIYLHFFATSLPAGRILQQFLDTLRTKLQTVTQEFADDVSDLTLSDYAYIQKLSLQEDGHPLGDYVLWLFGSYFAHLLFGRALASERVAMDAMAFEDALPTQSVPSRRLAEIYRLALFDVDVGPVAGHPLGAQLNGADPTDLALSLGDVFAPAIDIPPPQTPAADDISHPARLQPDLYMIINAQCDLMFAPNSSRRIDSERSILLLPGQLHSILAEIPDAQKNSPRTELYAKGEDRFRVLWDPKRLISVPYGQFYEWLATGTSTALNRVARLRLPYALELQRGFTADLMRVGTPAAPPIYEPIASRPLLVQDGKVVDWDLPAHEKDTFLVLTRDGQRCVLTLPLVNAVKCRIELHINVLREKLAALAGNEDSQAKQLKENLPKQIEALRRLIYAQAEWMKMLRPAPLPTATKPTRFLNGHFQLTRGLQIGDPVTESKLVVAVELPEATNG